MRDVTSLIVPPPQGGADAFSLALRDVAAAARAALPGLVQDLGDGRAQVMVAGVMKLVRLATTARAIYVGDVVEVSKRGGEWVVTGSRTWHAPDV